MVFYNPDASRCPHCGTFVDRGSRCATCQHTDMPRDEEAPETCTALAPPGEREPELTPELQEQILARIKIVGHQTVAAGACGVSRSTWRKWRALARTSKNGPYRAFFRQVRQATRICEQSLAADARKGANRDPKIALTMLARLWPKRWSEKRQQDDSPQSRDASAETLYQLVQIVFRELEPHPELRARIADALEHIQQNQQTQVACVPPGAKRV